MEDVAKLGLHGNLSCFHFIYFFFIFGGEILNHQDAIFVFPQLRKVSGCELMASVVSLLHQHLPLRDFCRSSVWLVKAGTNSAVGCAPPPSIQGHWQHHLWGLGCPGFPPNLS